MYLFLNINDMIEKNKIYYNTGELLSEYDGSLYKTYYITGELCVECLIDLDGIELQNEAIDVVNKLIKHGLYKSFYKNGQLYKECNYKNNKLNGLYKEYYLNGRLKSECHFINGKSFGIYNLYHSKGP